LPPAFWDSSALAPLCVREPTTQKARALLRQYFPVVWWGSRVEIHSAIARSLRNRSIDGAEARRATGALERIRAGWTVILPGVSVLDLACRLVDLYPLRAADSLQLAAALDWCQERPAGRVFLCGDKRLSDAAKAVGFSVIEI